MSSKHVWRPMDSYASTSLGSEEGGRGSLHASSSEQQQQEVKMVKRRASIPRRRTPTVHIPPPAVLNCSETNSPSTDTGSPAVYKTIEKNKKQSLLDLSQKPYEKSKAPNPRNDNWFCGWTKFEHLDLHYRPITMATAAEDRCRLQTPGDGYRSTMQSRASNSRYNSSHGRRKAYSYTFHHFMNSEDHIENYRTLYCFSALNSDPSSRQDEDRVYCEGEDVEQDAEVTLPLGVKSLYRGGDPYIRELVNRLGIRGPPPEDWERHQQLLATPRPTPPSIVKKRKDGKDTMDMMVANSAPKRLGSANLVMMVSTFELRAIFVGPNIGFKHQIVTVIS